jgi:hypothetical protein
MNVDDPINNLIGEMLKCQLKNGREFIAQLIKIHDGELYFKNKDGRIIMDKRSEIVKFSQFIKRNRT